MTTQVKNGILSGEKLLNRLIIYYGNKKPYNRLIVFEIVPICIIIFFFVLLIYVTTISKT